MRPQFMAAVLSLVFLSFAIAMGCYYIHHEFQGHFETRGNKIVYIVKF